MERINEMFSLLLFVSMYSYGRNLSCVCLSDLKKLLGAGSGF